MKITTISFVTLLVNCYSNRLFTLMRQLKPKIGNENLLEITNDNDVRIVNFATLKKSYCHKYSVPTF
jgi:hypothetical protein